MGPVPKRFGRALRSGRLVRIAGTSQPPKRVPTCELIAYLALHPNGASHDELIEALWPAQDPKKTRRRLWDLATDARAALGDTLIHEGERYRLDRAKVRIDLDQLDQLLASTDADSDEPQTLEAALALWRGEPLEGPDYIWVDGDIHRLRATLLGLLERAGHARLERGDARSALQMAEQAIALDLFHEATWRLALASRPRARAARVDHPPLRRPRPCSRSGAWAPTHPRDAGHVRERLGQT